MAEPLNCHHRDTVGTIVSHPASHAIERRQAVSHRRISQAGAPDQEA